MTLIGRFLRRYPNHSHRAQRTLPYDFPGVPPGSEPDLPPGPISGLSDRVSVQCEPVGFDVNVFGAIFGIPGVTKGS